MQENTIWKRLLSMMTVMLMTSGVTISASALMPVYAQENAANSYVVQDGDYLYRIAADVLEDGERWKEIWELNADTVTDPSLIYPGQVLVLPDAADMPAPEESEEVDYTEDPELAGLAQALYDQAAAAEPAVTADLTSFESDKAYLSGLEFRLKSVESTARKIHLDAGDKEISFEEAAGEIHDSLRYTYIIDDAEYVTYTRKILTELEDKGYKLYKFKNYWANDDNPYQGINTNLETPDGLVFEVQFHTPDSFDAKQYKTHEYYEIVRSETASESEKEEAEKMRVKIFGMVPVPDGVREFAMEALH